MALSLLGSLGPTVSKPKRRAVLNCASPNWGVVLISYLQNQKEVDLINARFDADWAILHDAAERFSMTIQDDHESRTVRFRRKSN